MSIFKLYPCCFGVDSVSSTEKPVSTKRNSINNKIIRRLSTDSYSKSMESELPLIVEDGLFLEYQNLKSSYDNLKTEHYDVYRLYEQCMKQVEEYRDKNKNMKNTISILRNTINSRDKLKHKKEDSDMRVKLENNSRLVNECEKLRNECEKLRNECKKLKLDNDILYSRLKQNIGDKNVEKYKRINSELINSNQELISSNSELKVQLNYSRNNFENIKYRLNDCENRNKKLCIDKEFLQNDLKYYKHLNEKKKIKR